MKKSKTNLFRGLASIFLALLVIVGLVGQVASTWAGKVEELLGSSSAVERSDNPEDYTYLSDFDSGADLIQGEIDLNTRLEAEGAVALKGTPAVEGTNVTLFGMRSGEYMQFGGSMGELVDASNVVTLAEAMEDNGFSVNPTMVSFYEEEAKKTDADGNTLYVPVKSSGGNVVNDYTDAGTTIHEVPVSEYSAEDLEGYKDAAIIVLGRDAGESACFYPGENGIADASEFTNSPTGNILSLSNDERDLVNWVEQQGFSKVIVLLNSGTAMEIEELKDDADVDSILWIGNPGAYGTYGIAQLLSGEVLPSGHLSDTFAVNTALSPAAQNYGIYTFTNASEIDTTGNNALRNSWYLVEAEGIYTGYTYYETRYYDSMTGQGNATTASHKETVNGGNIWDYDDEVSYTFGYGLEGSTFSEDITDVSVDWTGAKDSTITVKVTNTGDAAAKHTVQLYVNVPYTDYDEANGIEKSAIQLVGYGKTGESKEKTYADVELLEPGDSEEVTITFNAADLYSYDSTYKHDGVTGAYILEAGTYYFATGNGAHEAVNAVLMASHPEVGTLETTGALQFVDVDKDYYRTEGESGQTIQNQLEDADLNYWSTGTEVTYLSRSDWAGTFPESIEGVTATSAMITLLQNATYDAEAALAEYDGPDSFTYGADNGVTAYDLIGLDYDDPLYDELLDEMTLEDLCNQYISYLEILEDVGMPKENEADSPFGMIATLGQRSDGSIYEVDEDDASYGHQLNVYTSPVVVAATYSPLLQSEEGRLIANDCLWSGYTTWYGPGMNLHRTPYNGRNIAYYSEDEVLTGKTGTYVFQSLNQYGIITTTKHFAFNDQETNRDGLAVFMTEQTAREGELRGFEMAIRDGDMKGIMSAFNRIGCTHVAASQGLMNGILRGEWGYNGYLITDSIKSAEYFLPIECLMAGNDRMLGASNSGSTWGFTVASVEKDIVVQAGLREAYHRKLYTYVNSVMFNGVTSHDAVGSGTAWWVVMLRIGMGLCLVGFLVFFVLFIKEFRKERR
jgi:beta-glucosidase